MSLCVCRVFSSQPSCGLLGSKIIVIASMGDVQKILFLPSKCLDDRGFIAFSVFNGKQGAQPRIPTQKLEFQLGSACGCTHCIVMKLSGSVLCVLLLTIVHAVVGAPTDYASVRAEVVKAYAQQAEEMARALEVLQETSTSTFGAAEQIQNACAA